MQQKICVRRFFQSRLERFYQLVRQPAHQSYCINEHDGSPVWQSQCPGSRIQGGKQFIFCQNACIGERVEQGRFPYIGVADDGHRYHAIFFAARPPGAALPFQIPQLFFQRFNPPPDVPPIAFQFAFAGSPGANAAAQTRQGGSLPHQPR